ncbi:hypothetical protein PVAP13_4KG372700 [Panicum virgatum]|uniref:Uncharacterized protein n=1 Tax=Panicum virgatum TaxID=38727 RepID=A0A8T0TYK8_PANVG|nr:hypothetical protein PVAP13_4KG372700 [Panicum virgatum]
MDVAGSLTANREEGGGGAGGRGRTGDHPGRPSCLCASRGRCTGGWGAASQWSRDLSNHLICSPKLYFSSPRVTLGACFCVSGLLGHWYVGILKKYRMDELLEQSRMEGINDFFVILVGKMATKKTIAQQRCTLFFFICLWNIVLVKYVCQMVQKNVIFVPYMLCEISVNFEQTTFISF